MGELEKIQREAFEVYFDYGLTADYTIFDITRIFNEIAKEEPRKVEPEKNIAYFKALQTYLRDFKKRKAEERRKREEEIQKVQEDVDFLESVGVNVKSHINVEKIVPEIIEEPVVMEAVLDTDEAKFFEPKLEEEPVLEVEEIKKEEPKEIKTVIPEKIKTVETEKVKSEPKEKSFDMSELSYVDSELTDIEKFAASYFEKPVEHTKKIIYADESNKVQTDLQEFKTVEMPKEEPKEIVKTDFTGILDDSYQTKTENFNKRHEEVKVDFGDLGNVEEEKKKNQNTINDDVPVDDDDPFIFGFTSIKK